MSESDLGLRIVDLACRQNRTRTRFMLVLVIFHLFDTVLAIVLKNTSRIFVFEDEVEYEDEDDNEPDEKINPQSKIPN